MLSFFVDFSHNLIRFVFLASANLWIDLSRRKSRRKNETPINYTTVSFQLCPFYYMAERKFVEKLFALERRNNEMAQNQ